MFVTVIYICLFVCSDKVRYIRIDAIFNGNWYNCYNYPKWTTPGSS